MSLNLKEDFARIPNLDRSLTLLSRIILFINNKIECLHSKRK